jgi:hypothetical protein
VRLTMGLALWCYRPVMPTVSSRLTMAFEAPMATRGSTAAPQAGLLLDLLALLPPGRCGAPG